MDKQIQKYIIGENQHARYEFVLDNSAITAQHQFQFYLESNAHLVVEMIIMNTQTDVVIDCVLRGQGSFARIVGAYCVNGADKVNINTMQHHEVAHTQSTVVMRGVLYDAAQVQFNGMIRIDKKGNGASASQENKNILLSERARAVSVPSLEVLNNDVRCFHASAIGRFDKEQIFYAASRGIDEKNAQKLLLHAFFGGMFTTDALNEKMRDMSKGNV